MATTVNPSARGGPGPRPGSERDQPLSRDRIVDAALAVLDREGADALSMRRVAAELGAGTMSLYNHVADKAQLQRAVLERVLDGIEYEPDTTPAAASRRLVHAVRARLLEHPGSIGLLGNGVGPEPLVHALAGAYSDLTGRGVPGATAVRMIQSVARFTIGFLLAELVGRSAGVGRSERDADFDFGLDAMFSGFAVQLGVDPDDPNARL